ncbi:MAG TPA: amino acid adenylation domain-containing protein, partial [Thermoanaerobaculia bacterium]|nr:amino acid adenylation domain-containing protein [Thermoanaerobaculia bacterium]
LPIQYADFAVWQRRWLRGQALERQLAYWREALAGAPTVLELPVDRPRGAARSSRGASCSFAILPLLASDLAAIARREETTLFSVLLAGFQALLARWSGQDDVVVGSPVANRNRLETESLIGFFVNTLVLRLDLSGDPGFTAAVGLAREAVLGASDHQDLPFEKLVEELAPTRDARYTPLFQVMFAFQNTPAGNPGLSGLTVEPLALGSDLAKFDLMLAVAEEEDGLGAVFEYNADLFDAATIQRLGLRFEILLQEAVKAPQERLFELPLLSPAELRQVLRSWNETATAYPREATLPELFALWVERTPEAEALSFGDEVLTYREVDVRSNQLARHLESLGISAGDLVGVCLERSAALVVTLLAIVKAGAAYLPLDPTYPAERLAWMLEDAGASVVVTLEALAPRLATAKLRRVCLDVEAERITGLGGTMLAQRGSADGLAYVMYTSGSTGRPKGTAIPQRAIVRLLFDTDYVELGPADRIAHVSNVSFDAATFEIWGALLHGGCLVGVPRDVALSPGGLAVEIERQQISAMFLTAALFHQTAREAPDAFRGVRHLLAGGEALDPRWVREVLANGAPERLINGYGPTECTTFAVCHPITSVPEGAASVPIGRPIANTTAYVLDHRSQPVAPGSHGELYLGGDGLALGYLGRPDLTAERFVPNAFPRSAAEAGTRLYRTGDLVRSLPDGTIDFLGRADNQVKLRGFRIELGEIESLLSSYPAVSEAVAVVREAAPGDRRLVAYVAGDALPAPAELRAFVAERLPEYMVPSVIVSLASLPLTPNGKVDRRALPDPAYDPATGADGSYVAPRTIEEKILAGLWAEVLGISRVGAGDDFFALGGHSLLATQLVSRVRGAFGREVPLAALFEAPTVAEFAAFLHASAQAGSEASAIVAAARDGEMPLSFAQERLWFLDQLEPGGSSYSVPAPLRLEGRLDVAALEAALREEVRRHEALRTTFPEVDGRPVQRISPPPALLLPVVDLAGVPAPLREAEQRRLAAEDARRPFDLARGPLLRAALLRCSGEEAVLLLNLHHIVADGWSAGLLVRELAALYGAALAGEPSPLPELAVQYADFARWQR